MRKPNGYWTKERCYDIALKYDTRKEFSKHVAHKIAQKHNWLDEICYHMKIIGNIKKRCIYAIEFSDNNVYVGLSYNYEKRFLEHLIDTLDNFINRIFWYL